jgi:4-hydroxybenzoate polyprenyltransferase
LVVVNLKMTQLNINALRSLHARGILKLPVSKTWGVPFHKVVTVRRQSTAENQTEFQIATPPRKASDLGGLLIDKAPRSIKPYLRLARVDKNIGTWLLLFPCLWSMSLGDTFHAIPDPYLAACFTLGAIVMRGAGCTVNDIWDRDIDAKVERTRIRPIASGEVSVPRALLFLSAQAATGLAILLQFNPQTIAMCASSLVLVAIYPLMKRITHWPQFVLGLTFNWGALVGYCSVMGYTDWSVVLPLYCAGIAWT